MSSLLSIHQVLISVFDKSKILNFAQFLFQQGVKILSTKGTTQTLSKVGLTVHNISDYIKCPEIMNGRIKTLHYKIYAGILNRTNIDNDILSAHNIQPIDMVIVNFYPFHAIAQNKQFSIENILEYIDIGGPSMIRAAAKNYQNTVVIVDYHDYQNILHEMNKYHGSVTLNTRFNLATKAFKYITEYDTAILNYFNKKNYKINTTQHSSIIKTNHNHTKSPSNDYFPKSLKCINIEFIKKQNMRYGENPHQKAALYTETNPKKTIGSIATAKQLQGKPLSYNNILDLDTALECVKMFTQPTCVIVKHTNPCGVATSDTIYTAYKKAYQADPTSAFGGIIAFNRSLDIHTTQSIINQNFVEAIIAPDIHQNCFKILSNKKHIRVLSTGSWKQPNNISKIDFKKISGGLLIQNSDTMITPKNLDIVTNTHPTEQEIQDAIFCWKIVKFVKSNGIVCGKNHQTTGIGSGQLNRVHAVKIATAFTKHQKNIAQIQGSVMASDAFFPFPDSINIAAKMGIHCIIQPGGSIRDTEIIKTANQHNISMIFTHTRHFRH